MRILFVFIVFIPFVGIMDSAVGAADSAPLARECLEQNQLAPFREQVEQAAQRLEVDANRTAEYLYYLRHTEAVEERQAQLFRILNDVQQQLERLNTAAEELYTYLDGYDGEDWETRFGASGFYDELMRLRLRLGFLDAAWRYYAAWGKTFSASSPPSTSAADIHASLVLCQKRFETLATDVKKESLAEMLFWQGRVQALMAYRQSARAEKADKYFQQAARQTLSPELSWTILYEQTQLGLWQSKPVRENIKPLELLLAQHSDKISLPACKQVCLALLQGELRGGSFTPLQELLRSKVYLRDEGEALLGVFLAQELAKVQDTSVWIAQHEPWEIKITAERLRQMNPPDRLHAALLYEAGIDRIVDNASSEKSYLLFRAGQCRYQLIDFKRFDAADRQHAEHVVQHWSKLAEYPQWSISDEAHSYDSLSALTTAADLSLQLYAAQPNKFTELAKKTLGLLVGRFEKESSVPLGPFAESDAAKKRRYYFAALLENLGEYALAAQWFEAVGQDDSYFDQARYHAIYCRYQLSESSASAADVRQRRRWIDDLRQLAEKAKSTQQSDLWPAVSLLMVKIYESLNEPMLGLTILQDVMEASEKSTTAEAGLSFLTRRTTYVGSMLREDRTENLRSYLLAAVPVSREIYRSLKNSSQNDYTATAQRLYLEHLALLNAYARRLNWQMPDNLSCLDEFKQELEQINPASATSEWLWLWKVQGLAAYAMGDYPASQEAWQKVRACSDPDKGEESDSWWLARVWSLRCLAAQNRDEDLRHVIDVLRRSRSTLPEGWGEQIKALCDNRL